MKMARLHPGMECVNSSVEKAPRGRESQNSRTPYARPVDEDALALLQVVSSPSRLRILSLLSDGVDHPEELAKRMKLRRQGVDKQLLELYRYGFVDRSATLPAGGRPRIVYRISGRGHDFLSRSEALVLEYREGAREDYQRGIDLLQSQLASGEVDEDAYLRKRQDLEARYAPILPRPAKK